MSKTNSEPNIIEEATTVDKEFRPSFGACEFPYKSRVIPT